MAKENTFQAKLIKELKTLFPGCVVLKNDAGYLQGVPDILIMHRDKWAALECKKDASAIRQPNQEYYISEFSKMSYAKFIYPENKEEVLSELQQALGPRGATCIPRSE